jgi:N6-adenosine-specific RNA methylase IME4
MTVSIDPEFKKLIPPLRPEEYVQLEANIKREGCRDPLVLWKRGECDYVLIDGHNRYEICEAYGVQYAVKEMEFVDRASVRIWIRSNQMGRRNLNDAQRIELQLGNKDDMMERGKIQQGKRTDLLSTNDKKLEQPHNTRNQIAEAVNVATGTIAKAEVVRNNDPEKWQECQDGKKTINRAYTEVKREEVKQKQSIAPPSGKYRIIYADPPWQYADKRDGRTTGAEDHYPTMSIQELCDLPVEGIVEDDAVLFMWVTSPLLEVCFQVIKAWGFKYKTSFIWDKIKHNMGHYNSVRHELLLVCTRGQCTPDNVKLFDSVQSIEKTGHSEKPEEFREIIDTLYTHGDRIELFRRGDAPEGWKVWGNETA